MRPRSAPLPDRPEVVVVDDEAPIRDLLRAALEREGYRVSTHVGGEAALEDLVAREVALVITDLRMPNMGGLELIRAAKQVRPDVSSIVMTAYASTENAVQALRFGVDDFLTKPFDVEDLRQTVGRVLAARRLATRDFDAVDRARREAEDSHARRREAEDALASVERDLQLSRRTLERRVGDLGFVSDLTALLARESDLERLLERTVKVLAARFGAHRARLEVALPDGVHVAQQEHGPGPERAPAALTADLLARARRAPDRVAREVLLGATGRLEALATPLDVAGESAGGLLLLRDAPPAEDQADRFLLSVVPPALSIALELQIQRREVVERALQVATGMLAALEGRGTLHRGHGERVARLAEAMARSLGSSGRFCHAVATAARLHDVGQVGIPDEMLQRAGPLAPDEREILQHHPVLGARILSPFGEAAAFVRHHHERPDGTGYPDGLAGEDVPLGAGLVGCAEAFDAMTHHRAWRPARTRDEALAEIQRLRGQQFVPAAVDALLTVAREPRSSW